MSRYNPAAMDDSVALLAWLLPLFPLIFVGFWLAITHLLSHVSGWRTLAAHYATHRLPAGVRFRFCSATLRGISFRGSLNLAAAPDGLFLWPFLPFRPAYARLFVPWPELTAEVNKRWLVSYVVLRFAKAPNLRFMIRSTLAERLAASSNGALRIGAKPAAS